MVKSRSYSNMAEIPAESGQAPVLQRSGSTKSLPGSAAKQRPQAAAKTPDPANDVKAHARHLKTGRPEGSFREGYLQHSHHMQRMHNGPVIFTPPWGVFTQHTLMDTQKNTPLGCCSPYIYDEQLLSVTVDRV